MDIGHKLILQSFWLAAIVISIINFSIHSKRAKQHVSNKEELARVNKYLLWIDLIVMNVPWIVMGIGIVLGDVPTVLHFFRPRDGNPFVLAFHGVVVVMWILDIIWIYFKGGAEFISKYPGISVSMSSNPR